MKVVLGNVYIGKLDIRGHYCAIS